MSCICQQLARGSRAIRRPRSWRKRGAEFLIVDNTIHQTLIWSDTARRVPGYTLRKECEWEARRSHFKRLGVLGTKYLMEEPVYPEG
jgi:aspartate/glutamate racemase